MSVTMAVRPLPRHARHRYTSSDSSVGSSTFASIGSFVNVSGCFDDDSIVTEYERSCFVGGQAEGSVRPLMMPSPPPPSSPLRRRLGAGDSIMAATSPEIRALNLPFTPLDPGRRAHLGGRSLSPSSIVTADFSVPLSPSLSCCSASRTTVDSLQVSGENSDNGGGNNGDILSTANDYQGSFTKPTLERKTHGSCGSRMSPDRRKQSAQIESLRQHFGSSTCPSKVSIPGFSDEIVESNHGELPSKKEGEFGNKASDKENVGARLPPRHRPSRRHVESEQSRLVKENAAAPRLLPRHRRSRKHVGSEHLRLVASIINSEFDEVSGASYQKRPANSVVRQGAANPDRRGQQKKVPVKNPKVENVGKGIKGRQVQKAAPLRTRDCNAMV